MKNYILVSDFYTDDRIYINRNLITHFRKSKNEMKLVHIFFGGEYIAARISLTQLKETLDEGVI